MKAVDHELDQAAGHAIWEQNGRPHGQDKEHWEQAERELLDAAPAIEAKAPAKPVAENAPWRGSRKMRLRRHRIRKS